MIPASRVRIYLDRFWNEFAGDPSKIDEATREHYAKLYALPGATHSAFAQFRSIRQDAQDNMVSMGTKLTMPVLAVGGQKSFGSNEAIEPAATIAAERDLLSMGCACARQLASSAAHGSPGPSCRRINGGPGCQPPRNYRLEFLASKNATPSPRLA